MAEAIVVLRAEAKRLGHLRYFTGLPCISGHIAERLTINGSCVECTRLKRLAKYRADPAADLARQKEYRLAHPERAALARQDRHEKNPEMARRVQLSASDMQLRAAAAESGASMYESLRPCTTCGTARRFSSGGKCVECNRRKSQARHAARMLLAAPEKVTERARKKAEARVRAEEKARVSAAASAIRSARQAASQRGDLTYIGKRCPAGHEGIRYTKGGNCKACVSAASASVEKKEYDRIYLAKNREAILARVRVYQTKNKDRYLAKAREWSKANPERRKAIAQNYTHRRRANEDGGISSGDLLHWKRAQRKVCYWCGCKCDKGYHVDHYQPLSKGGKHEAANLVIACKACNLNKGAKDPLEFAAKFGRLF